MNTARQFSGQLARRPKNWQSQTLEQMRDNPGSPAAGPLCQHVDPRPPAPHHHVIQLYNMPDAGLHDGWHVPSVTANCGRKRFNSAQCWPSIAQYWPNIVPQLLNVSQISHKLSLPRVLKPLSAREPTLDVII